MPSRTATLATAEAVRPASAAAPAATPADQPSSQSGQQASPAAAPAAPALVVTPGLQAPAVTRPARFPGHR
ncbi:hypothetical protein OG418_05935 [Streptomyces phaeochromogenes]|uniref:hypothetical protein n=1 Tax=Streptomyces phaeochromogenes TaxID=1923 RepID=UPI002DDBE8E8|nr:hypothetical protein [Streptomyces phaeochromogenes]WRZ35045.1 hypothetical protein OG931_48590 [Streptomyces phaeochromogenes]